MARHHEAFAPCPHEHGGRDCRDGDPNCAESADRFYLAERRIDFEKRLVGRVLLDGAGAARRAGEALRFAEDFLDPRALLALQAACQLAADDEAMNARAVHEALVAEHRRQAPDLAWLHGAEAKAEGGASGGPWPLDLLLRRVTEPRRRRREAELSRRLTTLTEGGGSPASLARIRAELAELAAQDEAGGEDSADDTMRGAAVLLDEVAEFLDGVSTSGGLTGLTTGLASLDAATGGWPRAALSLVAATPGMGKSALVLQAAHRAAKAGGRAVVFSLEMPARDCALRMVSTDAAWSWREAVALGGATDGDAPRVREAFQALRELDSRLFIDDASALQPADIVQRVERIARQHGPVDLVVVDHVGLAVDKGTRSRYEAVTAASDGLRELAKRTGAAVVAACQLSRKHVQEQRPPGLADLRDSGQLEADAHLVLLLYRSKEDGPTVTRLHVAKARDAQAGRRLKLGWRAECTRFEDGEVVSDEDTEAPPARSQSLPRGVEVMEGGNLFPQVRQ